ncbi:MAG: putative exported protein [Paucimonas sp.]|nr:putative exported protein [Paucimonas sp.]
MKRISSTGSRSLKLLLASALLAATGLASGQQAWPTKPIRLVVPFAPGGATDQVARLVSTKLSNQFGVSVLVENKPGANGNIGADYVAKSAPDGYTLLHSTSSLAFTAAFKTRVPYDLQKDLAPVSLVINQPLLIMASNQSGITNVQTLRDYAKKQGKLNYGSSGNGNLTHLAMFVALKALDLDSVATHIPYKGGAGAFPDFIAGRLDLFADPINSAYPYVRDKRVTALAVTGMQRSALAPSVPTVAESMLPGFSMGAWQALMAPAGTPVAIVNKISAAYAQALKDPEVAAKLAAQGAEAIGSTPDEFKSFLDTEVARWDKVVQSSGIRLD